MLPLPLLTFLTSRGYTNLAEWASAAQVPLTALHQARAGRPIAQRHVEALALAVGESPSAVRGWLSKAST